MLFPHTITVFNRSQQDDEEIITRTVVRGVLMINDENTARNKLGLVDADTVQIYVPFKAFSTSDYVDPFKYAELNKKQLNRYYTFSKGDYVAFGDVSLGSLTPNEFKNKYGNLYEITGVSDYKYGRLKHKYVSAR